MYENEDLFWEIDKENKKRLAEQRDKLYELVTNGASAMDVAGLSIKYLVEWIDNVDRLMYRLSRRGTGRRPNYDLIRAIRAKRADGMTMRDIATKLRCSSATVTKYCRCDDQGNYTILPDVLPR